MIFNNSVWYNIRKGQSQVARTVWPCLYEPHGSWRFGERSEHEKATLFRVCPNRGIISGKGASQIALTAEGKSPCERFGMEVTMEDVTVIGAGASGLTAAINSARHGARVLLIEKMDRVGKKLLATGNGRCNISNSKVSPSRYHGTCTHLLKSGVFLRRWASSTDRKKTGCTPIHCRLPAFWISSAMRLRGREFSP